MIYVKTLLINNIFSKGGFGGYLPYGRREIFIPIRYDST